VAQNLTKLDIAKPGLTACEWMERFPPSVAIRLRRFDLLVNVGILPDGIWQMAARFQADAAAYQRAGLLRIVKVGA